MDDQVIFTSEIDASDDAVPYNTFLDHVNLHYNDSTSKLFTFDAFKEQRVQNNRAEVLVNWDHGSSTWEPVSDMKEFDLLATLKYEQDNKLSNTRGWK